MAKHAKKLVVKSDTPSDYTLVTKSLSHRGKHPMYFGTVRLGKAYVSYHLLGLYMNPEMTKKISPALKKRMQGKACFNFKSAEPELFEELSAHTEAALKGFEKMKWL